MVSKVGGLARTEQFFCEGRKPRTAFQINKKEGAMQERLPRVDGTERAVLTAPTVRQMTGCSAPTFGPTQGKEV